MKQLSIRNTQEDTAALPGNEREIKLQILHSMRDRKLYTPLPAAPRRLLCRTKCGMLAALRAAEYDLWQATGGDYLASTH